MTAKAVVLLSGGMDSTTALFIAMRKYEIVGIMFLSYGQRGARYERDAARAIVKHAALGKTAAPTSGYSELSIVIPAQESSLYCYSDRPIDLESTHPDGLPLTFVPGRNLIFLSYATSLAYELDATVIVGGWTAGDRANYPDCSPEFLSAAASAMSEAINRAISIYSPVLTVNKAQVVGAGEKLGVPWEHTRSCYGDHIEPCWECDSCIRRSEAFKRAGVHDPLEDMW